MPLLYGQAGGSSPGFEGDGLIRDFPGTIHSTCFIEGPGASTHKNQYWLIAGGAQASAIQAEKPIRTKKTSFKEKGTGKLSAGNRFA